MTYEIDCSASRLLEQTFVPPLRLLYKFFCFLHEICEEIVTANFYKIYSTARKRPLSTKRLHVEAEEGKKEEA